MQTLNAFESAGISPADLKCITPTFLANLVDLDFPARAKLICENIINLKIGDSIEKYYKNLNLNATVLNVDSGIFLLDLTDGEKYACYKDYVFGESIAEKFASVFCALVSAYVDAADSGAYKFGSNFDLAFAGDEGLFPLAAYYAIKCGLPIGRVFVGLTENKESDRAPFYERHVMKEEADDISFDIFDELSLTVDPYTAAAILAEDENSEDDSNPVIIVNFASPYLFSRRIFNNLFALNEISPQRAIKRLYEETALPIPDGILSGKIQPFFKLEPEISYSEAALIIAPKD